MLLVIVAGITAYLLEPRRVIDAIALGFSAPEILSQALGSKKPATSRKRISGWIPNHNHVSYKIALAIKESLAWYELRRWWGT
jgi:hypothetical protein